MAARRSLVWAGVATAGLGLVGAYLWLADTRPPEPPRILVLPAQDECSAPDHATAQTAHEQITAELGRQRVAVGSRTTLRQLTVEGLPPLVQRLKVSHVLESTCRRLSSGVVRLSLRLLVATSEAPVWQGTYEIEPDAPPPVEFWRGVGSDLAIVAAGGETRVERFLSPSSPQD